VDRRRREKVLPGAYDSPESREAFARLQLELATSPAAPAKLSVTDTGPTIAEVFLAYLKHATSYYGKTTELRTIKEALRIVRELYGFTPAGEFGPKALAAVRESFIRRRWARAYINRQMGRVTVCVQVGGRGRVAPGDRFPSVEDAGHPPGGEVGREGVGGPHAGGPGGRGSDVASSHAARAGDD